MFSAGDRNGNGAPQAQDNESPTSLLYKCIENGRTDVLVSILSDLRTKPDFNTVLNADVDTDGTLLHHAVLRDSFDLVGALLVNGASPCIVNSSGKTPFALCRSDMVKNAFIQEALRSVAVANVPRLTMLISSGVPVDSVDHETSRNTLLSFAVQYANADTVKALLQFSPEVDSANKEGEYPLLMAVRKDDKEMVEALLEAGANPNKKTVKDEDCFSVGTKAGSQSLSLLSMNKIARMQRSASVEVDNLDDRASLISVDTTNGRIFSPQRDDPVVSHPESWTDFLWPQPRMVDQHANAPGFVFPADSRLKIYIDDASQCCPRQMMQAVQISQPLFSVLGLDFEYRGNMTADHQKTPLQGTVTCGIFPDGRPADSYTMTIDQKGITLSAVDYGGLRYAFATLVQIFRIHVHLHNGAVARGVPNPVPTMNGTGHGDNHFSKVLPGVNKDGSIPSLTIRDQPDRSFRAVFQDFSGCRVLNPETLLLLASRISHCKANHLFVNFEVRTTDRYQLPYTNKDLFHMTTVCKELFVTLVPSLDTQTNYLEPSLAVEIVKKFLNDFPHCDRAHFGPNLASILIAQPELLKEIHHRIPRIFLSFVPTESTTAQLAFIPPYVTLCVEGCYPFTTQQLIPTHVSLVLKFSTGDDGYLCAAPDSVAKKSVLIGRLGERTTVLGSMICDLSSGCEAMPSSLSYMGLMSAIGVAWNNATDMKKFSFLIPSISAYHMLMNGDMSQLFDQIWTLGKVEHQLTRYAYGLPIECGEDEAISGFGANKRIPISVFVEMILNPENLDLERLTPVVFKKARIQLRHCLQALETTSKTLPYNYELALVLAEIKLVADLMMLICKLGQSLCMHGGNAESRRRSNEDRMLYAAGRVGVIHLPSTVRTDLANSLLDIRNQFQHVWLSRAIPSTLPNALKMFDNLFKALLPSDMQELGNQLL